VNLLARHTFIITLLFGLYFASAQTGDLILSTEKRLPGLNNQIVTLVIKIENKSDLEGDFQLLASGSKTLNFLKPSSAVHLDAKEKKFLAFKFLVTKNQPAGESPIEFRLLDKAQNVVAKSTTTLIVEAKQHLQISPVSPQEIIYQVGDSLRIKALVSNSGNQVETLKLVASFPSLSGNPISFEKEITIAPFTSKTVVFSKIVDRDLLAQELFNVNVAMLNTKNEYLGNTMVLVQNALGNRRFIDPNQQRRLNQVGMGNYATWSIRNPFSDIEAAQSIDINTTGTLGQISAELNLNATLYNNTDLGSQFQNSYLRVERQGLGLKLGSLSSSDLDLSLVGRGAEFYLAQREGRKTSFRVGALEKSYDLFAPLSLRDSPRGYSSFATVTRYLAPNARIESDLIFDQDPYASNMLFNTEYIHEGTKSQYHLSAAYGNSNSKGEIDQSKNSIALGLNYRTSWKKYTFNSENYYSSAYYPGIKKGTTQFSQRLGRSFDKMSLWLGASLSIYEPRHINPLYDYSNSTTRTRIDLGTQFRLSPRISMSLSPQFQDETTSIYLSSLMGQSDVRFQSALLFTSLGYHSKNNLHRVNFSLTEGLSRYTNRTKMNFVSKAQLSYYFKRFLFTLSAQDGNFMLYEGARNGSLEDDIKKYMGMLSYNQSFFNKKLTVYLNGIGTKDSNLGNSYSLSTNLDFNLTRSTKVFAYYGYTKYMHSSYDFANSYVQFGITQAIAQLGDPSVTYKNGVIEIFVYHDLDNNGQFTQGIDMPAVNKKVSINKTLFITGKDGRIKYRKVPYGEYTIKSLENEWYAATIETSLNSRGIEVSIPLEETGTVSGALKYADYNKNQYEVLANIAAIPVVFTGPDGVAFTFYTDNRGQYRAYLPLGTYTMSVDPAGLQQYVYVDQEPISVEVKESTNSELPTTTLKIRERRVEIKRFGEGN